MGAGTGTMGSVRLSGDEVRVGSITAARQRADTAGDQAGLRSGEIIWFDNGFYVELEDGAGAPATEVIVTPADGAVVIEPGPAMMWNTRYGARAHAIAAPPAIDAGQARQLAARWVDAHLPGRVVLAPDANPGYYTAETATGDGTVNGMLSVNATTGQVWYHTWHGRFIARQDA